jgi:ketosteroid isomerase-like protein
MGTGEAARSFLERIGQGDVDGALQLAGADATVYLVPLDIMGNLHKEGRSYLEGLVDAFPDLTIKLRRFFVGSDGTAVAEITLEGVQGADFVGIINQEKHLDNDQVWLIQERDGAIQAVDAYWCQNMVYRRLGVKRLDHVSITA